jgi:soluble lytic murein transglycosylase-like protein
VTKAAARAIMVEMHVRAIAFVTALAVTGCAGLAACGGGGPSSRPQSDASGAAASSVPATAVPRTPRALSHRLLAADIALRRAIHAWRVDGRPATGAPPQEVVARAVYLQRALRVLSGRPRLATAAIRRLPARLGRESREVIGAMRDLQRLSAGWRAHAVRTGPAEPLGKLLTYYRAAQRRFGVGWDVLAAVNLVESAFGRVRNESVAGARGPMQFMPSTWRTYGLGGDIRDPHDAILGAANLLRQAGAPESYARALYAYNPSPRYVDAVRRYARLIAGDRDAVYFLYSWPALARTRNGSYDAAGRSEVPSK